MGVMEGEGAEYMYPSPGQIVLGFLSKTRELTLAVTAVKLSLWCPLVGLSGAWCMYRNALLQGSGKLRRLSSEAT